MRSFSLLLCAMLLSCIGYSQQSVYGTYGSVGNDMTLAVGDWALGTTAPVGTITGSQVYGLGSSTFDPVHNHYIFWNGSHIVAADAATGSPVYSIAATLGELEYDSINNVVYGTYWDNNANEEVLAKVDFVANTVTDVGVIAGMQWKQAGSSTIDVASGYYIVGTNLGITFIDVNTANVVATYVDANNMGEYEYDPVNHALYGLYNPTGNQVRVGMMDIDSVAFVDIGSVGAGVQAYAAGSGTFDHVNRVYALVANGGIHYYSVDQGTSLGILPTIGNMAALEFGPIAQSNPNPNPNPCDSTIISGTVTVAGGEMTDGTVYLLQTDSGNIFTPIDSLVLTTSGSFTFSIQYQSQYTLVAVPNAATYPDAFVTYLGDVPVWNAAQIESWGPCDSIISGLDIDVYVPPMMSGTYSIGGVVATAGSGKNASEGDPIEGAAVMLINVTTGEIINGMHTDEAGEYLFDALPIGSYQIMVQMPNMMMESMHTIDITDGFSTDVSFDFEVGENSIAAVQNTPPNTTGVAEVNDRFEVSIYPTAGNGLINVSMTNADGQVANYAAYNVVGEAVQVGTLRTNEQQTVSLDGVPGGVYFFEVQTATRRSVNRIVIR